MSEASTAKSAPAAVAMETTVAEGGNNSAEPANSHSSASEPESESSTAAGIVAEVRELYSNSSKVDILIRLIQSRTVEVKYQRQLEVYQVALYEGIKEKTRLQLDLAYYDKMLAMMERGAQENKTSLATVLEQHADAVKMIQELDLKRTQLIKDEQQIKTELAEYKEKFLQMQRQSKLNETIFYLLNNSLNFSMFCSGQIRCPFRIRVPAIRSTAGPGGKADQDQ